MTFKLTRAAVKVPARNFGQTAIGQRIDFLTGTPSKPPFTFETNTTIFSGTLDPIGGWGYNYGYSFSRPDPTEPVMRHMIEGHYDRGAGSSPRHCIEQYWEGISVDSTIQWRPFGALADRQASAGNIEQFVTDLSFIGPRSLGILFYAVNNASPMGSGDITYRFKPGNLEVSAVTGFDAAVDVRAPTGRNSKLRLGSNGANSVVELGTLDTNTAYFAVASFNTQVYYKAINSNTALSVGINNQRGTAILDVQGAGNVANPVARLRPMASATGGILRVEDSSGNLQGGFDKNGHLHIAKNAAPADADIAAGQCFFWFDATNGAAKLKIKGKSANGTVVAGEIALA